MSDHDIAFWTFVAESFAAVGTVGALAATIFIFVHQRQYEARLQPDGFLVWLRGHVVVHVGADAVTELTVRAKNNSGAAVILPIAYVPHPDGQPGYVVLRLYPDDGEAQLDPGIEVRRFWRVADMQQVRGGAFVRFQDARNQWWTRSIETGRYISNRRWARLERANPTRTDPPIAETKRSTLPS